MEFIIGAIVGFIGAVTMDYCNEVKHISVHTKAGFYARLFAVIAIAVGFFMVGDFLVAYVRGGV